MRIKSLTARVLLLTTVWSTVALVVIGLLISTLYRRSAERGFQDLLRAQLYNVINSVTIGDQGALSGSPQLGDLRFAQPKTGWYWVVEPLGTYTTAPLVSPSLGSATIPVLSVVEAPFDKNYERYYQVTDASGNRVQVAETEVVLDTDGRAARFRVTGNVDVVEDDVRNFSHRLYLALAASMEDPVEVQQLASMALNTQGPTLALAIGKTALKQGHDPGLAAKAHRVIKMSGGKIIAEEEHALF